MNPDGSSDMAANAWPGFVDILSAVVIMFVFFVLIISAVLYFYTMAYQSRTDGAQNGDGTAVTPSVVSPSVLELQAENDELREQIKAEQRPEAGDESEQKSDVEGAAAFSAQSSEQAILTSSLDNSLVVFHDPGAITVNAESEEKIALFINNLEEAYRNKRLKITVASPRKKVAATQTRANRLAVARMLNVRNSLLRIPVAREMIAVSVADSEQIEGSDDWTRIQVRVLE